MNPTQQIYTYNSKIETQVKEVPIRYQVNNKIPEQHYRFCSEGFIKTLNIFLTFIWCFYC